MTKKLTIDHVRIGFESRGWHLYNDSYVNSQKKLSVRCPNGHDTDITWNNFQREQGCKYCARNVKYTIEEVRKAFSDAGCELLDDKYENNNIPVKYRCVCKEISEIRFASFLEGGRCELCRRKKLSDANRTKDEDVIKFCESAGCKFIASFIQDGRLRIKFECSCNRKAEAYWDNFKRFPNCWECGNLKKSREKCHRWNPDREKVAQAKKFRKKCSNLIKRTLDGIKASRSSRLLGYTSEQLNQHITNHPNMKNIDGDYDIDHIFPIKAFWDYGIKDVKIINCLDNLQPLLHEENLIKFDKYDREQFEKWVASKGIDLIPKITLLEWIDSLNIKYVNDKDKIKIGNVVIKCKPFKETGRRENYDDYMEHNRKKLHLITIYPDEWNTRQKQCCNYLKSVLHIHDQKIHARKCIIRVIEPKLGREFFRKHHIQGTNRLGIIFFGLFNKEEMVGVMSLGRHSRQGHDDECILDRMCFKDGIQVNGGASKLFAVATNWTYDNGYKSIVSFSDNRWSLGKVYEAMGFELDDELVMDYSYYSIDEPLIRLSKQSQKKNVSNCPEGMTEMQWATKRGLARIWDCGKKRWVYEI